jgi:hypothetical protein
MPVRPSASLVDYAVTAACETFDVEETEVREGIRAPTALLAGDWDARGGCAAEPPGLSRRGGVTATPRAGEQVVLPGSVQTGDYTRPG